MSKPYTLAAGIAAWLLSSVAMAQFGPPPPGSAQGTESGTYGSSIGFDVRGTGTVDRFGRPYDPMNPTDAGTKAAEKALEKANRRDLDSAPGFPARGAGGMRGSNAPGANMNPGLTPGAMPGESGVSPNMNPGLAGPGAAGNAAGPAGERSAPKPSGNR